MVTDLQALADGLLAQAAESARGRATHAVVQGERLRVMAMALRAGESLGEHDSPPAATLQVLRGEVSLSHGEESQTLRAGELSEIPDGRHDLSAVTDAVVVLTVWREG